MGFEVFLHEVAKRYQTNEQALVALDDLRMEVEGGQVVAVMGPSGSGKSTLLHVIGAMDRPDAGTVKVDGFEVTGLSRAAQASYRRTIGFVFQRFFLLPALTVLDNVMVPVLPYKTTYDKFERGRELLSAVGLAGREASLPSHLSGGEQQRVAIARALMNDPGLLLADEPTGNLDSETGGGIVQLLLKVRAKRGMTVIVATHDPVVASECDRVIRLRDGRVVEDLPIRGLQPDADVLNRIGRLDAGP